MNKASRWKRPTVKGKATVLALVFGDQLDIDAPALKSLDRERDAVLMMEVADESSVIPSHKQRTVFFLAAMRHFATRLIDAGYRVHYTGLDDRGNTQSLRSEITRIVGRLKPEQIRCTEPGEWRVKCLVEELSDNLALPIEILPDEHFLVSREEFRDWMAARKQPVMEHFYREQRRKYRVLLTRDGKPVGGQWNYDKENRGTFKQAPDIKPPYAPRPNAITREVIDLVNRRFPENPGALDSFRWPVTRDQARRVLNDFIEHRLSRFGNFQDAMWTDEPFVYHSLLSAALNVKLLNPRECVEAAVQAYEAGSASLNCVEGFVRQIIGWREFIRGIYWHEGQDYGKRNALDHHGALPEFYWTGETDMACMRESLGQVIENAYGHHIQRLMVTGNFALIAGISPQAVSDWYLGMYVDAVDWVTLPNTLGMALHADGGVVGTKPYAASGKYIQRMSNYCEGCPFDPAKRHGPGACPFTTLYWEFLIRHRKRFASNNRMTMMLKHVERMSADEQKRIRATASELKQRLGIQR